MNREIRRACVAASAGAIALIALGIGPAQAGGAPAGVTTHGASRPQLAKQAKVQRLRKLWVVPAYWDSAPAASVRSSLVEGATATANYFNTQSDGRTRFVVGGVEPALRLDAKSLRTCDVGAWGYKALMSITKKFNYGHDALLVWTPNVCGGGTTFDRPNNYVALSSEPGKLQARYALLPGFAALMGLGGAGPVLTCQDGSGTPTTAAGSCTMGGVNPFTQMDGSQGLPAASRIAGELASDNQWRVAPESGEYLIHPRGRDTGTTLLEVPWKGNEYFGVPSLELELVSGEGSDAALTANPSAFGLAQDGGVGVTVSLCGNSPWVDIERPLTLGSFSGACPLLNMHPERGSDDFKPTMGLGDSWTTPDGSLTLSVESLTPSEARIRVQRGPDMVAPFSFQFGHSVLKKDGSWRTVAIYWGDGLDWFPDDVALQRSEVYIDGKLRDTLVDDPYGVHARVPSDWTGQLKKGRHAVVVTSVDYAGNSTSAHKVITIR